MKILGIETSCDETAAAVVADGTNLLSNVVASQIDIHAVFGGVVPEVAARSHIEVMLPVVEKSLKEAGCDWDDIEAIAITQGPGLLGSLLVGTLTASTLAKLKHKPLVPVNHVEAHVYSNFLLEEKPDFPLMALIVSGGHTQLVLFQAHGKYQLLGQTHDDAAGEAFDKVAKIIGLPYPGGPSISKAAINGNERSFTFPKPKIANQPYAFSFSGLKTAVLRAAQQTAGRDYRTPSFEIPDLLSENQRNDIAASFQRTVVEILSDRLAAACAEFKPAAVVIGGGVAANRYLRKSLETKMELPITYAPINMCTDNAAMIASLGYYNYRSKGAGDAIVAPSPTLSM